MKYMPLGPKVHQISFFLSFYILLFTYFDSFLLLSTAAQEDLID